MITLSNHRFSVRGRTNTTNYLLANVGQMVTHKFILDFSYNFNSSSQSQIIISGLNELTFLNGTFTDKGIIVGDSLDVNAAVDGGTDVDVTGTVDSINGNVLTFDSDVFTAGQVNELFPLLDNAAMFIVNNTRSAPNSIDLFYNFAPNSEQNPTVNSIWDGTVNQFQCTLPTVDGDSVTLQRVGLKSGGYFYNATVEKLDPSGEIEVSITYLIPLANEQVDFNRPSVLNQNNTVKPYVKVDGYSQLNNPNSFISGELKDTLGNVGWYNENYNQGSDDISVDIVSYEDLSGTPLTSLRVDIDSTLVFRITSSTFTFDELTEIEFRNILPFSVTKNNADNYFQNFKMSNSYVSNSPAVNESFHSPFLEIDNITITPITDGLEISLDILPDESEIASIPEDERLVRFTANFNDKNNGNNITKIISETTWSGRPKDPKLDTDVVGSLFFNHANTSLDIPDDETPRCSDDDFVVKSFFKVNENEGVDYIKNTFQIIRDSDGTVVCDLYSRLIDFTQFIQFQGKYLINQTENIQQFLDSFQRNQWRISSGTIISGEYKITLEDSIFVDWRYWLSLPNFTPDFYDPTVIVNGQSKKWAKYLGVAGYSARLRSEISKEGEVFYNDFDFDLIDYNKGTDNISTVIQFYDEDDNEITELINNTVVKVVATHTYSDAQEFNESKAWTWIGVRPKEGAPMKRISSAYDWTIQNLPLLPLDSEDRGVIEFPSANVCRITCQVNTTLLANVSTFVSRVFDEDAESVMKHNVDTQEVTKFDIRTDQEDEERLDKGCGEPWLVLADPSDSTTWKNDHTLVFEKCSELNVYTIHNGVKEVAKGVVIDFPNDSETKGFLIDWRLYYDGSNELIQGQYTVVYDYTIAGKSFDVVQGCYNLYKYDRRIAEGTVRIASIFNDFSEIYNVDFSGSGARDSVRLNGFFGYRQPNYETKNNTELSRKRNKVFRKSNNVYSLIIEPTTECKTRRVEELHLLHSNNCYISDFNDFNHVKNIRDLPVILSDDNTPELDYFEGVGTRYAKVLAEFKDVVSARKSKNNGLFQDVPVPDVGLWKGVVCVGGDSKTRLHAYDPINNYSYCGVAQGSNIPPTDIFEVTRIEVFLDGTTDVKTASGVWNDRENLNYN